jgi:hypothetical protein
MLYHLSHALALFALVIFQIGSCAFCMGQPQAIIIILLHVCSRDCSYIQLLPVCWLRWGFANFLPGLVSNCDPPEYLGLQVWLPHPALQKQFKSWHGDTTYSASYSGRWAGRRITWAQVFKASLNPIMIPLLTKQASWKVVLFFCFSPGTGGSSTGRWTWGCRLARQAVYLSHFTSPSFFWQSVVLGFELKGFLLARQGLYCLSQACRSLLFLINNTTLQSLITEVLPGLDFSECSRESADVKKLFTSV